MQQLLRRREVEAQTRLSRSAIYARMAQGEFPRPVRLGPNSCRLASKRYRGVDRGLAHGDFRRLPRCWLSGVRSRTAGRPAGPSCTGATAPPSGVCRCLRPDRKGGDPARPGRIDPRHRAVADDPGRADPGRPYALAAYRSGGRSSVACIEYDLTIEQAVLFMLDQYRRAERLNAFAGS